MYSHLIPISIYVAIEIMKYLQMKKIDPPQKKGQANENPIKV